MKQNTIIDEQSYMTRNRIYLISAFILLLLIGSFYDIITSQDHWPFSNYGMFAKTRSTRTTSRLLLFGVVADSTNKEVFIHSTAYIQPFDNTRLSWALEQINFNGSGQQPLQLALQDCLQRYEQRRKDGRHKGPALKAIKLYRYKWEINSQADNIDYPSERVLLAQTSQSEVR